MMLFAEFQCNASRTMQDIESTKQNHDIFLRLSNSHNNDEFEKTLSKIIEKVEGLVALIKNMTDFIEINPREYNEAAAQLSNSKLIMKERWLNSNGKFDNFINAMSSDKQKETTKILNEQFGIEVKTPSVSLAESQSNGSSE